MGGPSDLWEKHLGWWGTSGPRKFHIAIINMESFPWTCCSPTIYLCPFGHLRPLCKILNSVNPMPVRTRHGKIDSFFANKNTYKSDTLKLILSLPEITHPFLNKTYFSGISNAFPVVGHCRHKVFKLNLI